MSSWRTKHAGVIEAKINALLSPDAVRGVAVDIDARVAAVNDEIKTHKAALRSLSEELEHLNWLKETFDPILAVSTDASTSSGSVA